MIEDALFAALGFCAAVVLAVACLPLLWARALRLTRQRLELLVPWSKQEVDGELDGMRAQSAVALRRLEQEVERSRSIVAAREVAFGQQTVELVRVETNRDALQTERSLLLSELAARDRDRLEAEAQRFAAEKALHDADRQIETASAAAVAQAQRFERLTDVAEERRGLIASLETRVAGLKAKLEDKEDALVRLDAALAQVTGTRTELAARFEALTEQHGALGIRHATAVRELEAARQDLSLERRQGLERDARLAERAQALLAAEDRLKQQDDAMSHKDARFQDLQARFDALREDLAASGDDARLRAAVTGLGDEALSLLGTESEPAPPRVVQDAQP